MEEDYKKIENIQNQLDDIEVNQEEKYLLQNSCFCFEGFSKYKYLILYIKLLIFLLVISTIISIDIVSNFIECSW
jgi:hypothetical protein